MPRFSLDALVRDETAGLARELREANTDKDPTKLSRTEGKALSTRYGDNYRAFQKANPSMNGSIDPYAFLSEYALGLKDAAEVLRQFEDKNGLVPYAKLSEMPKEFQTEVMHFVMSRL